MIFVIEALGLTSGGGKAGLMRLLPALARHTEHQFVAIVADLPELASLAGPNVKIIARRKPRSLIAREIHLQRAVPHICGAERADALLCLGNFAPRRGSVPAVVLLHNARYVSRDAAESGWTFRERLVTWYGRRMLRQLPSSARLVVQTELMRQRVADAYPHLALSLVVIPDCDGLEPGAAPSLSAALDDAAARALTKNGAEAFDSPFRFLCLAHYYPHKNLETLVDACRLLRRVGRPMRCVLTIDANEHPGARRLLRRIDEEGLGDVLMNAGPLAGGQVAQAYRAADAFVLPTLLESFGRTYREAMRFGVPILTSNRDFARDACGDAAVYFDPRYPESIARSMAEIMEGPELRRRLARTGRRKAGEAPSWNEIAAQFVRVLEDAATRDGGWKVRSGAPAGSARSAGGSEISLAFRGKS